jgi:RecA/RadA recombinase
LRSKGGTDGECIYIDTEGSFLTSRFIEMASGHDVDQLLRGLHYFRVLDHAELMGLMRQLPEIVKSYPKVRLIIIDSIAYHFRLNVLDSRARTAILYFLGRTLVDIARANDISVNIFIFHDQA